MNVAFTLNGKPVTVDAAPTEKLIDTLRETVHILSVKRGCENGDCGACTVLVDGEAVTSCIYLTAKAQGREVRTVEYYGTPGHLHPIQEKFRKYAAFQCGFCAPGMTLSAISLLEHNPAPSEEQIRQALYGNLCRCSGYVQVVEAVKEYVRETTREDK